MWPDLDAACTRLAEATAESPAPALRDDPRLLGDWELVGTSSKELGERCGLTGLGGAPFTAPAAIFGSFLPSGEVVSKEGGLLPGRAANLAQRYSAEA